MRATVLIPTHDHGPLLRASATSALAQTVRDLELFIVGDGVPAVTRRLVEELQEHDPRVRFFDYAKGQRHGEAHRHAALSQARGHIVCYLSDDDLWLPHHIETMERLLAGADFAHALSVQVDVDGSVHAGNAVDLSRFSPAETTIWGIPLSCMAHTMELYRRLPGGWRTTPAHIATDTHMCRRLLAQPGCRAASGTRPTSLQFPSVDRLEWSPGQRLTELNTWSQRVADPQWVANLPLDVLDAVVRSDAEKSRVAKALRVQVERNASLRRRLDGLRVKRQVLFAKYQRWKDKCRRRWQDLRTARQEVTGVRARQSALVAELRRASRPTLGRHLASVPVLSPLVRLVARLRARQRAEPEVAGKRRVGTR